MGVQRHRLLHRLEHERLVVIKNFLPERLAETVLRSIEAHTDWNVFQNGGFSLSPLERFPSFFGLRSMLRAVGSGMLPMFSAGCFNRGHGLPAHDDRAYFNVDWGDGRVELHSRKYAVVYYLTKNWQEEDGGIFINMENDEQ